MKNQISSIFAPITTPFTDDEVDVYKLKQNVHKYSKMPLAGFFALGSNGENKSLSYKEKLIILETIVSEKASNQIVIAGTYFESTRLTLDFTREASNMGVNYASLAPPSYFKKNLTDEALFQFFMEIADHSPIPVILYNAPDFFGTTISMNLFQAISRHQNVVGMKDSSQGLIIQYLGLRENNFAILSGSINYLFPALVLGASGGVVSIANAYPQSCYDLYQATQSGSIDLARTLHNKLINLNRSISGSFGVAGVKYAMDIAGYFGGLPRRPLLPLRESDKELIKSAIESSGVI
jgi:4-hydroxy-2-oxoglutarate aldolase